MSKELFEKHLKALKDCFPDIETSQWNRIQIYLTALERWNQIMNLTGFPVDQWCDRIVAESLVLIDLIPQSAFDVSKPATWFDMGCGAGIPGLLVNAVYPDQSIALIDSRAKKTDFCLAAIAKMGLCNSFVLTERLENTRAILPRIKAKVPVFLSRALAEPTALVEYAEPYSTRGSVIVSPRSGRDEEKAVQLTSRQGVKWKGQYVVKHVPLSDRLVQCLQLWRDT